MPAILDIESRRLVDQHRLDALKTAAERNRWGQFATPPDLAQDIARYASELWQVLGGERVRFLDPAIGTGAFYSATLQSFTNHEIQSATGVELDPLFASAARDLWQTSGLNVVEGDFTNVEPSVRANLVLTNPPYVRHHHLPAENKDRMRGRIATELGLNLNGLAGLYCHFLLLADRWLESGGLSVWLIPTEFMTVNYGQALKDYLLGRVTLLHVHRFCPSDVQFADALVSSVVVAFQKMPPPHNHAVRFTFGGRLDNPQFERVVSAEEMETTRRWTSFSEPPTTGSPRNNVTPGVTLGELFNIKRGIATGDNKFFVLPRRRAVSLGIPEQCRRPILPSPRYMSQMIVDTSSDGYPLIDEPLCVIDCHLPEDALCERYPQFWKYLEAGKQQGVAQGYLASRRDPWYSQERRSPAPFLCTYMGRASDKREGNPFRFIWNKSQAIAANVYLLLYPKGGFKRLLNERPELQQVVFESLSSIGAELCLGESRVYGGGLYKLEPRELGRVSGQGIVDAVGGLSPQPQQLLFA